MNLPAPYHLRVPFTSANLGPGFDLFGVALDLYARFQFTFEEPGQYRLFDEQERPLDLPGDKNYIRKAYLATLEGKLPPEEIPGMTVHFQNDIPGGRGFGSSACAFVAGTRAAAHLLESRGMPVPSQTDELRLLDRLEGHPDNSTPALIGGWTVVYDQPQTDQEFACLRKELPEDLGFVALIPDYTVSTKKSRTVLPPKIRREEALSGMRGTLLWLEYIHTGRPELLERALLSDLLHEPYRAANIPGFHELRESLPCHGITISGSGPGLLVYYSRAEENDLRGEIESRVQKISERGNHRTTLKYCLPDYEGAVTETPGG